MLDRLVVAAVSGFVQARYETSSEKGGDFVGRDKIERHVGEEENDDG